MRPAFQATTWKADWRHLIRFSGLGACCAAAVPAAARAAARAARRRVMGIGFMVMVGSRGWVSLERLVVVVAVVAGVRERQRGPRGAVDIAGGKRRRNRGRQRLAIARERHGVRRVAGVDEVR